MRSVSSGSRRAVVLAGALGILAASLSACFDNPVAPLVSDELTDIQVGTEGIIEVGDTSLVGAYGHVDGVLSMFFLAPILDARWAVSAPSVVRLDPLPPPPADSFQHARALVHALAPGITRITATSHGVVGEATLRVIPRLRGIEVVTARDTIAVGDTIVVRVDGIAEDGRVVADLPAPIQASGGVYLTRQAEGMLVIGTEAGPASLDASFRRASRQKGLIVVARSP